MKEFKERVKDSDPGGDADARRDANRVVLAECVSSYNNLSNALLERWDPQRTTSDLTWDEFVGYVGSAVSVFTPQHVLCWDFGNKETTPDMNAVDKWPPKRPLNILLCRYNQSHIILEMERLYQQGLRYNLSYSILNPSVIHEACYCCYPGSVRAYLHALGERAPAVINKLNKYNETCLDITEKLLVESKFLEQKTVHNQKKDNNEVAIISPYEKRAYCEEHRTAEDVPGRTLQQDWKEIRELLLKHGAVGRQSVITPGPSEPTEKPAETKPPAEAKKRGRRRKA